MSDRDRRESYGVVAVHRAGRISLGIVLALVMLLLPVDLAQATRNVLGNSFGAAGSGAGQMLLTPSVNDGAVVFAGSGLAVDSTTHDVYVADTGNHRVDEFAADGTFVRAWGWGVGGGIGFETCTLTCQAGLSGSSPGELEEPVYVTIDESPGGDGDVYVGDAGDLTITKFTPEGSLIASWGADGQVTGTPTGAGGAQVPFAVMDGIAVSSTGMLDVDESKYPKLESVLFQFQAGGAFSDQLTLAQGSYPAGLAIGSSGELFKANANQTVEEHASSGADVGKVKRKAENFGEVTSSGLAVNSFSPDTLYVDGTQQEIEVYEFNASGEVEQPGGSPCRVEPRAGCTPTESFGAGILSASAGIAVDASNGHVYVADTGHGRIVEFIPRVPAAPVVAGEWAADVTEQSADVSGEVNPEGLSTEYQVEYGPCASAGVCAGSGYPDRAPMSGASVGSSGYHAHRVGPVVLEGLQPNTAYHYRLSAENAVSREAGNPARGGERVFTTTGSAGVFSLLDGREWEMVSPPNKQGALIEPIGEEGVIQAAGSGDALTYITDLPTEPDPQGYQVFQQVFSTRGADGGWSSQDIEPPHAEVTGLSVGQGREYMFFSEDLSRGILDPLGPFDVQFGEEATPPASEQTPFMRMDFLPGEPSKQCTSSCYEPLVTGAGGHANVPEGTVFGLHEGKGPCVAGSFCGPEFEGATPDTGHVVLGSGVALTSTPAPKGGLYEWSAGAPPSEQLRLVSQFSPNKGIGAAPRPHLGWEGAIARNAISADGERVVWENEGHLYVRLRATHQASPISEGKCTDPEDACTVELGSGLTGPSIFQVASRETDRVFFINSGNLYSYDVSTGVREAIAEGGEVAGKMIEGASEDGSWVYFAASGVLGDGAARGATHGACDEQKISSTCNLYVWHDGAIHLVAVLSNADDADWDQGSEGAPVGQVTARVSPNGEWLAFMSQRSLTGYDNADAVTGEPDEEVYEYNARTERLICASCNPTGGRPTGVEYRKLAASDGGLAGGKGVWLAPTRIAANVPGMTPFKLGDARYQSRYLADSGRLFFNSSDALVSKDVNGQEDVYEFEPESVGSCTSGASSGSVVYEASAGGCVGLISSGTSPQESAFLDASESGGDVFFLTDAKLVSQDRDTALDVYDAHECTSASPCLSEAAPEPTACNGEGSCRPGASVSTGALGASGSATFSGPGEPSPSAGSGVQAYGHGTPRSTKPPTATQLRAKRLAAALKQCEKLRSKRRRTACVRMARHRYGPVKRGHVSSRRGERGRGK